MKRILVSTLLLGALAATPVMAQVARGAAGGADPVALTAANSISLTQAVAAAQAAIDACAKLPKNPPIVVSIFDVNGNAKVQLAADGYQNAGFEYARKKAYTVLKNGISSGEFGKLPDVAATARGAAIRGDANLIQYAGALPISRGGAVIGTISVSGPTGQVDDETCARAGLALIK